MQVKTIYVKDDFVVYETFDGKFYIAIGTVKEITSKEALKLME